MNKYITALLVFALILTLNTSAALAFSGPIPKGESKGISVLTEVRSFGYSEPYFGTYGPMKLADKYSAEDEDGDTVEPSLTP